VGLAAVLGVALVTQAVANRISRSTCRIGHGVRRLADGNPTSLEVPNWDDEISDLVVAVNQTAERMAGYERQIRKTEQLRTLALLGAGLAHEIRNAATGCRLALDLHAEGCSSFVNEENLSVARRQLDWMENRLQRFLALGRDSSQLRRVELDLRQLVDDLLGMVRPAARHAGVVLDWRRPPTAINVRADQQVLSQAIVNIVLNALEAAAQHHAEKGERDEVRLTLRSSGDSHAILQIWDNGRGPDSELVGSLGEPFVTGKREGVGLGLAVARQVIEAHGGSLDWQRDAGWTRFHVRLPLAAVEAVHV
jgi:signal transduction histidine kinase